MRSVFLVLFDAKAKVVQHLDQRYARAAHGWHLTTVDGDTVLYIGLGDPEEIGRELHQDELASAAAGRPCTFVQADVSGRYAGDAEVRGFVGAMLESFDGLAYDEYTVHLWSLAEIRSGALHEGRSFFDYMGWYEQLREQ